MKHYILLSLMILLFLCGCRNHIRELNVNVPEYKRTILRNRPLLQVIETDENNCTYRFKLSADRDMKVQKYQVFKTLSRYTPWTGWREYYEVPLGLLLLPVGVAGHAVNILTLGMYPFDWCTAVDDLSLSALNPGLNIEDRNRFEDELLHSRKTLVDTRVVNTVYPLRNTRMKVRMGNYVQTITTDSGGIVEFALLSVDGNSIALNTRQREFRLFIGNYPHPVYSQIISRNSYERLRRASGILREYHKKPNGKKLYQTIVRLERLKFSKLAHTLEKQELGKNGNAFRKAFYAEDSVR